MTDAGIEKLALAHPLTHLVITSQRISPAAIARLHKALPNAKSIDWRPLQPDALAAKQVLEWGGKVTIAVEGSQRVIDSAASLPSAAYSVISIDLSGPRPAVDAEALEILPHLKQLRSIDLRQMAVTDAGLEHLKKVATLTNIDLRETKVTTAGAQSLQAVLPKCKIEVAP